MSPLRKIVGSLLIVGMVTAGGVACGSDDSSKSSDSAASTDAWCKRYEKFEEMNNAESESAGTEEEEMAAWAAEMGESTKMAEDLAKDAPEEIRDDMTMLASFGRDMMAVDFEDEGAMAAFDKKYSQDKVDAASGRLEAFLKDTCSIDVDFVFGMEVDFNDDGGSDPDAN